MGRIDEEDARRLELAPAVREVHGQALVVDLHVDSILSQRLFKFDLSRHGKPRFADRLRALPFQAVRAVASAFGSHQPLFDHADIPRMLRGGYSCAALGLHYWPRQSESGWLEVQKQLDYFELLVEQDERLLRASTPADVRRAAAEGKLAAFCGLEGAHGLGAAGADNETTRLDRIETLYRRGVRYITLAHFSRNDIACHCFGPGSSNEPGLTSFGREVVRKMNEVGMLVDVAHVSHRGVLDVCELSTRPVIASHTGLAGVDPTREDKWRKRNISDEALLAIAATGGVVGIIFAPQFLSGDADSTRAVVRHLRHGRDTLAAAGYEGAAHLALGSDFDGWIAPIPEDLDDAADLPRLTAALLDGGFSERETTRILGGAFLAAWETALG